VGGDGGVGRSRRCYPPRHEHVSTTPIQATPVIDQAARDTFRAEAVEILRQEVPEDLEWLPLGDLPPMRWSGDGAPVDARIPRGWLVAAARRGLPEPDSELRRRAALFDRADAAGLGTWVLRAWIEHDTAGFGLTDARKAELRAIAERAAALAQRLGRGGTDPEARYRQLLEQEGNRPAATALPHQGLLAVVAACADGGAVADVERYLSAWHGERPARCRALLRMLSWIEAPAAAEALSAARDFPALRETAARLMTARADRR